MNHRAPHLPASLSAMCLLSLSACSFAARSGDIYREDTRRLLDTRTPQLQQCYEAVRESEKSADGQVTAKFIVAADTGAVQGAEIVDSQTSAPPSLQQCVLTSLQGLQLIPGDQREGQATFTWNFSAAAATSAAAE